MDSNPRFQLQQHHQPNSGLLRFRSAPSSVLLSGAGAGSAAYKGHQWESSEPEKLALRFENNNNKPSDKTTNESSLSISSSTLTRMNSQQGYSSTGVPSCFLRHNSSASSAMDNSSYGLVGSMGMDHHHQTPPKSFGSDLLRQSSFPATHFSNNISFQNGTVLFMFCCCLLFSIFV